MALFTKWTMYKYLRAGRWLVLLLLGVYSFVSIIATIYMYFKGKGDLCLIYFLDFTKRYPN